MKKIDQELYDKLSDAVDEIIAALPASNDDAADCLEAKIEALRKAK